tara:strand:- start:13002 stop:16028 length:3027 start_codon:yes stop_codon:yes gene_type:complete
MAQFKVIDYDIIYLSYDEPNAEENYANLLTKVPWAKRIHGVEGSDAAHKACAEISDTKRFITIDGDNQIDEQFLNQAVNFKPGVDLSRHVISWTADNIINGLRYGNGGIKCWDRETVLRMKTHENADPDNIAAGIDFCWDLEYIQINSLMSTVHNNATPQQAWRAGFREGVKMSLIEGIKPQDVRSVHAKNLERLYVWCTVGTDVENGKWAIFGAREGLYKTMCTDWNYVNVRDFEYLNSLWKDTYSKVPDAQLPYEIIAQGEKLRYELDVDIPAHPFTSEQSKFYKLTYRNPPRPEHPYVTAEYVPEPENKSNEYDIVMISYAEPNADENYQRLLKRYPRAKRIHGVKGIHNAHVAAANICETEMFWIIDGDAELKDDFNFDYVTTQTDTVHVWRSENPVNDLVYGYGGIKLFPTQMARDMDTTTKDMTTSLSTKFKKMDQISVVTRFNTGPFETWKSGFRECAKLSSKVIDRQKEDETNERLKTWTTVGHDRPFGEYAVAGATAGMEFGLSSRDNLGLINDFAWLRKRFHEDYPDIDVQESAPKAENVPQESVPIKVQSKQNTLQLAPRDSFIVDLLDRFEILYGDKVTNLRRFYNDGHLLDVLRILGNEDLRKFVEEKNYHSLFRYLEDKGIELEDERKVFLEKNIHSLFRLLGEEHETLRQAVIQENMAEVFNLIPEQEELRKAIFDKNLYSLFRVLGEDYDELRKAVLTKNPTSIFKYIQGNEDLRKILVDENPYSLFRLLEEHDTATDLKKLAFDKNVWALKRIEPEVKNEIILAMENNKDVLWSVLDKHTQSKFVKPLKYLVNNNIEFDLDCLSRGQLKSKKWLIDNLKSLDVDLGTVFLCAGWYATLVPMIQEADIKFNKIRSFDIDPGVANIAEMFNRDLALDGWKFKASTQDIFDIDYNTHYYTVQKSEGVETSLSDSPDTIVNTSCEHIVNFDEWYRKIPAGKLVILQSNDYIDVEEHVNCSKDIEMFSKSTPMTQTLFEGTLDLVTYRRFMKIGYK